MARPCRRWASSMTETPMASVFAQGHYVGAILTRGCKGFEAIGEDNASHGCFPSQREGQCATGDALLVEPWLARPFMVV
jgi:hypothetical protein